MPAHRRKPRRKLSNLVVGEVSLVDDGDNPGARMLLFKRRSRTNRPGTPNYDPSKRRVTKLTVTLQTQESGGQSPHEHALEIPDGALASGGTFRSSTVQGHFHDVALTNDLRPGDTANLESGPANPEPPEGVSQHNHSATITAVERRRIGKQDEFKTEDGVRFPRGAYALNLGTPSEWRLRMFDRPADVPSRPSVRLTGAAVAALGPGGFRGQRVQIPAGRRQRAIARLRTAWLRARRRAGTEVTRDDLPRVLKGDSMRLFDRLIGALRSSGVDPDDGLRKRLFDEVRADTQREQVVEVLMARVGDLARSIKETLFMPDEDGGDPEALVKQSLGQFASTIDVELSEIFAGRIVKALDLDGAPPDDDVLEELILGALDVDEPQADPASATKEGQMDLTKLSKDDRAAVEAALKAAGTVEGLTTKLAAANGEVVKLKKAADGDQDPDPLESLPEDVRKVVDPLLKAATDEATKVTTENAELRKRLDVIEGNAARSTFEKSVGDLTGLPQKRDDIVGHLWAMTDAEARTTLQKTLEASAEAARRGGLLGELGSDLTGGGSAYAQIEAQALEIRKGNPALTEAVSKKMAMEQNPDLYDQYLAEETGPQH